MLISLPFLPWCSLAVDFSQAALQLAISRHITGVPITYFWVVVDCLALRMWGLCFIVSPRHPVLLLSTANLSDVAV